MTTNEPKELFEKSKGNFYYKKRIEIIKKTLHMFFFKDKKKWKITLLDVGCGVGALFDSLDNKEDMICSGIDINESYVKFAKKRGHNVVVGDIHNIQLEEEYFDTVTLIEVLEHLNNPTLALERCHKFLKEDGILIITVPSFSLYRFLLYKLGIKKNIKISTTEHNFEFSPSIYQPKNPFWISHTRLFNLLKNSGFEIKHTQGIINLEFPIISRFIHFLNPLDNILGKYYNILGCRYLLVVAKKMSNFKLDRETITPNENNELIKKVSKFYNEFHLKQDRKAPNWMKNYWDQFKGNVLEIGAGTLVPDKITNVSDYLVVEISSVAVKMLKDKGVNAIVVSGENLPFKNNTFDTVACHDVLEHTPNPEKFIAEMCRVSRKKVVIFGPNYCGEKESILRKRSNLIKRIQNILEGNHKKVVKFKNPYFTYDEKWESDLDAVRGVNLWWVEKQIKKNGFKIIIGTTFIGKNIKSEILKRTPFVKYAGSMMFVVGRKYKK